MSRFALVFPGQGSQFPGMGRELAQAFPVSRALFEEADRALEQPLSGLCFDGPEDQLALTENTQPAILAVSVAAWRALEERGLRPAAAAGHSLGEYSAHVAAGTIDAVAALRTVRQRGRFMQDAVPVGRGAMAAILGLDVTAVEGVCAAAARGETVSPANINSPGQVVVAGDAAAVERAIEAALEAGARRAVPLAVSAPFHCELMRPAENRLRPVLERLTFDAPAFPVYANVNGKPLTNGSAAREMLARQVTAPVRWEDCMRAMIASGIETFVEVGPGKVLSGLARRIDRSVKVLAAGTAEEVERAASELGGTT